MHQNLFSRRRKYRLNRLRLHSERKRLSDREVLLKRHLANMTWRCQATAEQAREACAEADTLKERVARAQAELENVRRRMQREKEEVRKYAGLEFVEALVPALDSLDLALATMSNSGSEDTSILEGVRAIRHQIIQALRSRGMETITPVGEVFDPNLHEALAMVETEEAPENTVVDVLQNGYSLNGRVVRAALVRVARRP